MPTAAATAVPATKPPEIPTFGTMQLRPGEQMPKSIPPVMPTFSGGPTQVTSLPPSMPHERYAIGDEIARGGMGRVVEANDTVLGRTVALKEALALDADSLKRFERETKITARLEHPSIVPVHDAGTMLGGAPFYVMRKISGRPLERLVALAETVDERLALLPHMVAASNAIAHAHERGVVHRDIKPSNILVGELGETIVIDWGLAKLITEADDPLVHPVTIEPLDSIKTRAGIVYGTPGFMAPEQLRGKTVTERCDVYALGATLYHLLCRKPPHHAKTADEMMKAAAHAPPPSITEMIEGVPPELATIIDKCLRHDPAERYQTARELAEDLNRFLAGQLVASYQYSPYERLVRFVKRNKVPVAATAVLIVGLALAFVRVRGERDRADEAARTAVEEKKIAETERARAERELERVTLQQAKNEVETNPTRAVARIRGLALKHPRDARAIGIAARAAGVAWGLPASKATASLQMSKDGNRVLSAGADGVLRTYDLAQRTAKTVTDLRTAVTAVWADDERRIVAWTENKLAVMDGAGANRRDVTAPSKIVDLAVTGMTAYWVDDQNKLWTLDLAGAAPVEITTPEPVHLLAASPDGRWLALGGADHLMLYDRTQPATEPAIVTVGVTKSVDWSGDGKFLGALVDENAMAIRVDGAVIVNRRWVGDRKFVASAGDKVYSIGPTGVALIPSDSTTSRKPLVGEALNVVESRDGAFVAASTGGIAVLADAGDIPLTVPEGRVELLEASAFSPYVVAAVEERLIVWNLDDMRLRRFDLPDAVQTAAFVGNTNVLAAHASGPASWIDLASGKVTPLDKRVALRDIAGAPNGTLACVVDTGRTATLFAPGKPSIELEGTVSRAGFASPKDLVLADEEAASLRLYNVETKTYAPLVARPAKLISFAWTRTSPTWIAAAFTDGTLWRKNLTANTEATASQPIEVTSGLLLLADGTVLFGEGRMLRAWKPDGTIARQAELPSAPIELGIAGPGPAIAITPQGATYVVELDAPDKVTEVDPINAGKIAMAADTGTYVVSTADGFDVVDPIARHRWNLTRTKNVPYRDPKISADGRRVVAHTSRHANGDDGAALIVWNLPEPPPQTETAKWLDGMTNAYIDQTGRLSWR
jgi:WD40 repeat protein